MDLVLFAGAAYMSVSLPKLFAHNPFAGPSTPTNGNSSQHANRGKISSYPLTLVLGLSFILFALSVLEATPSSWLMVLNNQAGESEAETAGTGDDTISLRKPRSYIVSQYLTLQSAYVGILSILCAYVLIICPCIVGAVIVGRLADHRALSSHGWYGCWSKEKPLVIRMAYRLYRLAYRCMVLILTLLYILVGGCWRICRGRRKEKNSSGLTISTNASCGSLSGATLPMTTSDADRKDIRCKSLPRRIMCSLMPGLKIFRATTLLGSFLGISATWFVLSSISHGIITINADSSGQNRLTIAVVWVCAIGIILSTLLNGFGSVSMPHSCLAGLYLEPIRPETVAKAQVELQRTLQSLEDRRAVLKAIRFSYSSTTNASSRNGTRTTTFSELGEEVLQRKRNIMVEIDFLTGLVEEMREDIDELKYAQAVEANSRTTVGRIMSWIGVLFSAMLLYRLFFAGVSMLHFYKDRFSLTVPEATRKNSDPITSSLLWLLGHHMVSQAKYDQLSQFISLILTALLSLSQVRAFLRAWGVIHRKLHHLFCLPHGHGNWRPSPRNDGRPSPRNSSGGEVASASQTDDDVPFQTRRVVYSHLLASLMGSYCLACIVLTKLMMPIQYRKAFSGALGGFEAFWVHSPVVNTMFTITAFISAGILAVLLGIQRQNSIRHRSTWTDHDLMKNTACDGEVQGP